MRKLGQKQLTLHLQTRLDAVPEALAGYRLALQADGDELVAAMKGMKWESPRGPVSIDPETRDIVQNIYIRKVEKVNGELYNVEFETFTAVKDAGKSQK
jgi:ABC-type branched-subunit amino acid transport system substrate-binding protein